jgi:putative ubiquitin-RnfH superfamily antitoxin RatB of RatAB toxin-antitoxin module
VSAPVWRVQVAYAAPARQEVIDVTLPAGATVEDAIRRSGILARFPEIDLSRNRVGIYGEPARLSDPVHDGDRIEIYRPLVADPKDIRRARAGKSAGRRKKL